MLQPEVRVIKVVNFVAAAIWIGLRANFAGPGVVSATTTQCGFRLFRFREFYVSSSDESLVRPFARYA